MRFASLRTIRWGSRLDEVWSLLQARYDRGAINDYQDTALRERFVMWYVSKPSDEYIGHFLDEQRVLAPTFASGTVAGFNVDEARVLLGQGEAVYLAACDAIRKWRMFPPGWTKIVPSESAISVHQNVAVLARVFGLWWLNACRIAGVTNEARRFGFTYVTLPGHVEMGEELFLVEWEADDRVWYQIRAVSRPRYWMVRMAYPLARWLQHRFRQDSMRAMREGAKAS